MEPTRDLNEKTQILKMWVIKARDRGQRCSNNKKLYQRKLK